MTDWNFRISPNITLGSFTATRLGQQVKEFGKRFMLIFDPVLKDFGMYDKITSPLVERKVDYFIFDDLTAFNSSELVERALGISRNAHIDGIIACGGEKTLALAKCVCAMYNENYTICDILDGDDIGKSSLPLIAVLSTMRDSFLFTDIAPIVDSRSGQLKMIKVQNAICKLAIFDPQLCVNLTQSQIASMSLEVLCMGIESLISNRASFFSDMLAFKALDLYNQSVNSTTTSATSTEVLLEQCGCLSSLAVATSGIGAASLLALTINARFGVSRSLTSAILLPHIIDDAMSFKASRIEDIKAILHIESSLADEMRQRLAQANLPARLKDLNLQIPQLSIAAEDAGLVNYVNSLPRSMTADDLFELVKTAY